MILVHIASVYFTKSVSVLTAIILGEPWLASFTEAKDNGSGGDSCKTCKAPVKSSLPTNQHPAFYRPDALPVTQSTVSKHSRVIVQKKNRFFCTLQKLIWADLKVLSMFGCFLTVAKRSLYLHVCSGICFAAAIQSILVTSSTTRPCRCFQARSTASRLRSTTRTMIMRQHSL